MPPSDDEAFCRQTANMLRLLNHKLPPFTLYVLIQHSAMSYELLLIFGSSTARLLSRLLALIPDEANVVKCIKQCGHKIFSLYQVIFSPFCVF